MQKLGLRKPKLIYIVLIILFFADFLSTVTATEIVVNNSVPAVDYSTADIRAIFTMQKRYWANNRQIKVYTLADSNLLHRDFVKNNLHMLPHQIRRVWDRMIYSGTGSAPLQLDSEEEMIQKIANTPDSIGYLTSSPDNEHIRSFKYH